MAVTTTTLLIIGDGKAWTHTITAESTIIGRDLGCDVSIQHSSIAPRHAMLLRHPQLAVQDLGSNNGTWFGRESHHGGKPIVIVPGESFRIGAFCCLILDYHKEDLMPSAQDQHSSCPEAIQIIDPTVDGVPDIVRAIATSPSNVLVLGETGVGKDVLSHSIHQLSGRRGPCIRINCAALPESLVESELFGYEKGAFTGATAAKPGLFEAAQGGTVFLDEIGELTPELQVKLLRALEAGEITRVGAVQPIAVDVRFIAATNRDLSLEVAAGRFRADLYYRLDGISLHIPPLRDRPRQIIPLVLHFISARATNNSVSATHDFLARLEAYDWPGNVRELKATIDRAVVLAAGSALNASHLIFSKRASLLTEQSAHGTSSAILGDLDAAALRERAQIIEALSSNAGNQTRTARQLGISRASLSTKLSLYRIPRPRM